MYHSHVKMTMKHDWKTTSPWLCYLASPVCVSSWFTQDLYTSTGFVLMTRELSSRISFTTGARSWRSVFCPRAPLLKLTTILMTVGFPVTMSCTWSTFDLKKAQPKTKWFASVDSFKQCIFSLADEGFLGLYFSPLTIKDSLTSKEATIVR